MAKISVFIGRFQPLHAGHRELIRKAVKSCDNLVVLIGSANRPRSIKNPWSYNERKTEMLRFLQDEGLLGKVSVYPMNDYKYSDPQWISDVIKTVEYAVNGGLRRELLDEITLVGHMKRGNSYLKYFPQWKYQEIETGLNVSASDLRAHYIRNAPDLLPKTVVDDWNYFEKERKVFENYPFKATLGFMTADTLLECAGNILLIQRGRAPGQGTWALPGGFKNADENRLDCAIRELMEETNVRIPEKVLRGNIIGSRLFDAPDRGCGIPRETMLFHIRVEPEPDGSLPRANGADDAMECRWVPIAEVLNDYKLFDDHSDMIQIMLGATPQIAHLHM